MNKITSRAVIGLLIRILSQEKNSGWVDAVSNFFTSDQASEDYAWIGAPPAMQEWIGQRKAKGLPEYDFTIKNKKFEATLEYLVDWLRRDKFGFIETRAEEMVLRGHRTHWAKLLSTLILNGESGLCYDGQYFFDTDHQEGESPTQSNKIIVDISELPCEVHGSLVLPSVPEMQLSIAKTVETIAGFIDDQGEPMNEMANKFLVMVPPSLAFVARQAVATKAQVAESQTVLSDFISDEFSVQVVSNVRLAPWSGKFATFCTDAPVKGLIRQQEKAIEIKGKTEGSDYEFDNDAHQIGIDAVRNAGYGRWQNACLTTLG